MVSLNISGPNKKNLTSEYNILKYYILLLMPWDEHTLIKGNNKCYSCMTLQIGYLFLENDILTKWNIIRTLWIFNKIHIDLKQHYINGY